MKERGRFPTQPYPDQRAGCCAKARQRTSGKRLLFITALLFLLPLQTNPAFGVCVSYFYTSYEAVLFAPEKDTNISIRDSANQVVYSGTTEFPEQSFLVNLSGGNYSVVSTKRISLLVGHPVNGSDTAGRGYYALGADGKPVG